MNIKQNDTYTDHNSESEQNFGHSDAPVSPVSGCHSVNRPFRTLVNGLNTRLIYNSDTH